MLHNIVHNVTQLLFNMDETASTYNGKGKVVVPNDRFPLSEASFNIGHYTMLCCFNAAGFSIKPFIIVPSLMNLPEELKQFDNVAYFASSPSEWVTSRLFLAWTIFFVHSLRIYRLDNGMHLRKQNAYNAPCYLYLDGHKSRLNSEAIEILYQNNVRVIVFPSHTTHVLQPFDVALASPHVLRLKQGLLLLAIIIKIN